VLLLDVVRLPGAALLRSSSFPPSLWSFEDLETLPLLRRLSPPLVFSSDDGEKEEEEEEEEALLRPLLPLSHRRAPPLVSLLLLLDDDDVVTLRGEGAPERRRARIFFFYVYIYARCTFTAAAAVKREGRNIRGVLFFFRVAVLRRRQVSFRFVALLDCECVYISTSKFYSLARAAFLRKKRAESLAKEKKRKTEIACDKRERQKKSTRFSGFSARARAKERERERERCLTER